MPVVKRFSRARIEMYFGDHPPPHFHVVTRNNERVAVLIDTLVVRAGAADRRDIAAALSWARTHRVQLRSHWQKYCESE